MILDAIEQVGGIFVVTADHGNAEDMVKRNKAGQPLLDKNGNLQVLTSHTCLPVSFQNLSWKEKKDPTCEACLFDIYIGVASREFDTLSKFVFLHLKSFFISLVEWVESLLVNF